MNILALALALVGLFFGAYALYLQMQLKQRFNAALGAGEAASLERTLGSHLARVEAVDIRLAQLERAYEELSVTNALASQKIAIVRFNPFGDIGGDQSFSLAVLDAHDSGYVLTSLHGREGTRMYVKPVDYRKSKYTLSAEERQALDLAVKRVPRVQE